MISYRVQTDQGRGCHDGLGMLKRTSDDGTTVECLEKAHIQLGLSYPLDRLVPAHAINRPKHAIEREK